MFVEHGYSHSSIKLAAEYAGVSRACVYDYFDSTESLFLAVIDAERQDGLGVIAQGIAAQQPAHDILRALFDQQRNVLTAERSLTRARWEYYLSHPSFVETPFKSTVAALTRLCLYGQRRGEFTTTATPQRWAQHLAISLEGLRVTCWALPRPGRLIDDQLRFLYHSVCP